MTLSETATPLGLVLMLAAVLPICAWVAWSDMARMKIPNRAVMALAGAYTVLGPIALPLDAYLWGFAQMVIVLVAGFLMNMTGMLGAGDAKFAAAAAPFVALPDLPFVAALLAAISAAAFAVHRSARRVSAVREMVPDWESWHRRDFPFGLALGPALAGYLLVAATHL